MTYTLKINLDAKGYEEFLEKKFKYGYKLKRAVTNWFNMQEHRRRSSEEYKFLAEKTKELNELQKKIAGEKDKEVKKRLKEEYKEQSSYLKEAWIDLNNSFDLGSGKFVNYSKKLGQASHMYQDYADRGIVAWSTMENISQTVKQAYLKRRGQSSSDNRLPVGRYIDFNTLWFRAMKSGNISSTLSLDGIAFTKHYDKSVGNKRKEKIIIPFKFRKEDDIKLSYALEMQELATYAIQRILDKNGKWKYALLMVFNDVPYGVDKELINKGKVELTVDVNQLAIRAKNLTDGTEQVFDLTNDFGYSELLSDLDRKIEAKRRELNPDNYQPDGTIKRGKYQWTYDKSYYKLLARKRYLWHKIKANRKLRFGQITNGILALGDSFVVYKEDFKSLQARKDYNPEEMNWFDTRKQRGFEIMFNAPYEFISILKNKLSYKNITLTEITKKK